MYLLVLFVLRDGSEEVRIVLSVVAGDASLGTVADDHCPEVFGHPCYGLHCIRAGWTKHAHRGPEPGVVLGLDDVDEPLHHHVSLALAVVDAEDESVVGEKTLVSVDIIHCHVSN